MSELFLTVDGLKLRRTRDDDREFVADLNEIPNVPAACVYETREEALKIFDWLMDLWEETGLSLCIVEESGGKRIGIAGLRHAVVDGEKVLDLGMTLQPEHQKQGLGTAISKALIAWGHQRGYDDITAHTSEDNIAALSLLNTLGFIKSESTTITIGSDVRTGYLIFRNNVANK